VLPDDCVTVHAVVPLGSPAALLRYDSVTDPWAENPPLIAKSPAGQETVVVF
jgi:hypothetical protein